MMQPLAVIRGGGDLATGVAYRLFKCGIKVIVLEIEKPTVIRRMVSLAEAVFSRVIQVQDMVGCHIINISDIESTLNDGCVPVVVDPNGQVIEEHSPLIVIDARMIKRIPHNTDMRQAPHVIALGPGYRAGVNCHAVIETKRGHYLGRVIWEGQAAADTGVPGSIDGMRHQRVIYAPVDGLLHSEAHIGDKLVKGQPVGFIGDHPVPATLDGVLRGLVHSSVPIKQGQKIGDVDPRGVPEYCFTISDKALAIGGGALEAIFSSADLRRRLWLVS